MKKTVLLCILAAMLCFASCGKNNPPQNTNQATENQNNSSSEQNENANPNGDASAVENGNETATPGDNKLQPVTYYGGTIKSIEGDKLTLISDTTDEEIEFTLSENAKKNIEHFQISAGKVVAVEYDTLADGTLSAREVNPVKEKSTAE